MTVYVDMKGAIALLQSGEWELGYGDGSRGDGRYWLQQGGLSKGGKSVNIRASTVRAMEKRGLIEIVPRQPKQPFWLRRYRLTEKVSEAVSEAENVLQSDSGAGNR